MNSRTAGLVRRASSLIMACGLLAVGCGTSDAEAGTPGGGAAAGAGGAGASVGTDPEACAAGQTRCGTSCVDTNLAIDNCGACGVSCVVGQLCQVGQCQCQTGLLACGDQCVSTQSNGAHCGTCDHVCPVGQVCSLGVCGASCQAGQTQCGSSCADVSTDVQNCGDCGVSCATGQTCDAGTCTGGTIGTGGAPGTGGAATGGAATGGAATGGTTPTGGATTGGSPGTGGAATGGAVTGGAATGGAVTGGVATGGVATGGVATGGALTGGAATGGAATGGAATGGASTGGGSNSACPGADAAEFARVSGWLDNSVAPGAMPNYAYDNIGTNFPAGAAFDKLACSIAMSCVEFAPTGWLRECEAVVTSAIVAESSYNPDSVVEDSYGGAADPTVGLLQIRFSSTVQDYNYYGPLEKIAAIGCTWPSELPGQAQDETFWRGQGASYLGFMQDVSCNVGLGTWYYFYNATGNGGPTATWLYDYCNGNGTGGNMVVGLLSHLMGGNYDRSVDGTHAYPFGIECCAGGNPDYT